MRLNHTVVLLATLSLLFALPAVAGTGKFVGVGKCKICHRKDKNGNAYKIWKKTRHAKAFETLGTAKAKKEAEKEGIKASPQKAEACLICHETGAGFPESSFARSFRPENGIQCESCHGAGSDYRKKRTMKALHKQYLQGRTKLAEKYGFSHGDEKTCTERCHRPEVVVNGITYKNRAFKKFDYKERLKKIEHPIPQ
ncbi:MAG: hypothetical protein GY866_13580 [Proteobacteria bacterium]|nr:hypothetical protein [Pseudomonadota bacterium]